MNSSSDRRHVGWVVALALGLALVLVPRGAAALSVHAVYRTACEREVGVILRVEKRLVKLLRLDGSVATIPRHEIVSLLYYPVSRLPIERRLAPAGLPPLRARTRHEGRVVDLATGWPIDYSEHKLSFLLPTGDELVVDRASLWSLEWVDGGAGPGQATPRAPEPIEFVHPQTSGFCATGAASPSAPTSRPASAPTVTPAPRQVFAQQILNDQVVIRRELDRLALAFDELQEQEQDQKFYPVPFVYRNRTMLGLWASAGSRHGASTSRTNNFTPLLVDELALGPFRYQHVLLSGAAPNDLFLHHEAQSQIYYRFKAAYFHTSVFLDPGLLLVGTKYGWRAQDLDGPLDERLNEHFGIELGFDWGPLSLELAPIVLGQVAVEAGEFFDETPAMSLWRVGARLTFPTWHVQIFGGASSIEDNLERDEVVAGLQQRVFYDTAWRVRFGRANVGITPWERLEVRLSAIGRTLSYDAFAGSRTAAVDAWNLSFAATGTYALSHRLSVGGHVLVEVQGLEGTGQASTRRVHPKLGLFTGFWF